MRKPTVENKYHLRPDMLSKLIVLDEAKIHEPPFWRNDAIQGWCLSGRGTTKAANQFDDYDEYWLGIYDKDAKEHPGEIRTMLSSYGGMCSYNITEFFKPEEMENECDIRVQENFLRVLNDLIDRGVLGVPEE